jgi:glycosyltransferase involved in cell wall biosynthesis
LRVAVVVQRYGRELLGGAETHAALMAGILAREHDVEVLTTTAADYHEWREHYPAGTSEVDGVRVRRFAVTRGRAAGWGAMNRLLHDGFESSAFATLGDAARDAFARRVRAWPDALQEEFVRGQGPIAPELHRHLAQAGHDRVLFVTYLYPTTYDGLAAVAREAALVVPTLHDEPPAYLPVYGRRLRRARLLCSTDAEVALVARLYPGAPPAARRLGYGIPLPAFVPPEARRPGPSPYLLYAGRVDTHKGIPDLLAWYASLRRVSPDAPRLVLIGEPAMPLPRLPGLEVRGVVDDAEKIHLMGQALALVHPSPYESLGIVLLEAMACGTPLLVRGDCEVMVEHCRRGGGGLWVRDAAELAAAVARLAGDPGLRAGLGRGGRAYVEREYALDRYAQRLLAAIAEPPGAPCAPGPADFTRLSRGIHAIPGSRG